MFILIFTALLLAMQYIALLWTLSNTSYIPNNFGVKLLPVVFTALFFAAMFWARGAESALAIFFCRVMYVWLGTMFLWFCVSTAGLCAQIVLGFFKISLPQNIALYALGLTAILSVASIITAAQTPRLTRVDIATDIQAAKGLKIVQVSDTHLGIGVSAKRFKKLTDYIQTLNPDIVAFTGDIFEETDITPQAYEQALNTLNPALGKYGVLGNHEYYRGVQDNLALWARGGIMPLQNTAYGAGAVNIIGLNDIKTTNLSKQAVEAILQNNIDKTKFNLLLSHTPVYFDIAAQNGVNLMLSGHTHNGQLWPFNYLVRLSFKYVNGLYTQGNANLYVTSGTYFWGSPMRLFTNNEIVLITLI